LRKRAPVKRSDGLTRAEIYLKRLCDRTFLSLWSYSGLFRDQGAGKGRHGEELCDLLVVFENHVIVFSDKDCQFPDTGNLQVDWARWFRRAVAEPARQIWGAERWIRQNPDRLFLDRFCKEPFPMELPEPSTLQFHRIVVAHGVSDRCKRTLSGSGGLMIIPGIVGESQHTDPNAGCTPFIIGQIAPEKGYVHVLDDISLDVVLGTLDTITDFVTYLSKKEKLISSGKLVSAAGEDELLAVYLRDVDEHGEHDFMIPDHVSGIALGEGFWGEFSESSQRKNQVKVNRISYAWDALIETFGKHILANTQYHATPGGFGDEERILRFLAREPRTRRRMLGRSLIELIEKTPPSQRATRIVLPSRAGDPYYVFLVLPKREAIPEADYREFRLERLLDYCMVLKLQFPEAEDIVGIATESGAMSQLRSQDAAYLDARQWGIEEQTEAEQIQEDLGLLKELNRVSFVEHEYPPCDTASQPMSSQAQSRRSRGRDRNTSCPCGSGKKYKRCCGRQTTA
jgi:hypothetical protein